MTIYPFFLIKIKQNGCIYLDKNYNGYLFETKSSATTFIDNMKSKYELECMESKNYTLRDYWDMCNAGARGMKLYFRDKSEMYIPLAVEDVSKEMLQYYNCETSGDVTRLQLTKQHPYLKNLANGKFITPVKILRREKKGYPHVRYSYATFGTKERYFVLFTTLQEFEKWNDFQNGEWKPMEMSLLKFKKIRNNNPVFINPFSNKLILTNDLIKDALNEKPQNKGNGGLFT